MESLKHLNKVVGSYDKLSRVTNALKELDRTIIVTIGSWDLLHIGHVRYLINAKRYGDVLVVGVDSDRAIKLYKGPLRPVVPQEERSEMLSYQSCIDFITYVDDVDESGDWQYELLTNIKPDVYIAVENSYSKKQCKDISRLCGKLVILPRQAENTSTSKMIQNTVKGHLNKLIEIVDKE